VACLNAASLALVDAGVPMPSILAAVTSGHISSNEDVTSSSDPVLDLSNAEEQELPFLSVATVAAAPEEDDKVSVLVMESRIQVEQGGGKLAGMLALGVDGCKRVRNILEDVVRGHEAKVLRGRK
jgi:exosome complex component RRP41